VSLIDQEAKRRLEMAKGADALLERNADLETQLQDQVSSSSYDMHVSSSSRECRP